MPLVVARSERAHQPVDDVDNEQSDAAVKRRRVISRLFLCPHSCFKWKLSSEAAASPSPETVKIQSSRTVGTATDGSVSDPDLLQDDILARLLIDVDEHADGGDSAGYEISIPAISNTPATPMVASSSTNTSERTRKEEETSLINLLGTASFYFKSGRRSFEAGSLHEALYYQNASLDILTSSAMKHNPAASSSKVVQDTLKLEQARVYYEIARVELAILEEEGEQHLQSNYKRTEARSKLFRTAVRYYSEELRLSKQKREANDSLERRMEISQLLHILGRLYDEKIGDYSEALRCYNEALEVEESVLHGLDDNNNNNNQPIKLERTESALTEGSDDDALKREAVETRIEESRAKIGNLHYMMGDFVSAMKVSTFCAATLCAYS